MLEKQTAVDRQRWVWRTNLAASQPFWRGWYLGLSELFLQVQAPKLLILAGTDRLDKPLTIGQMQGKFQMIVLPQVELRTFTFQSHLLFDYFVSVIPSTTQPPSARQ